MGERSWNGRERNQLLWNAGGGRFLELGSALGLDSLLDGRGLAGSDLDHDGDVDFVINNYRAPAQLFLNGVGARRSWVAVRLRGTRSNRDGIGAQVTVRAEGREQVRVVTAGHGYVAQSSLEQLFGLDDARLLEWIEVRWPSGLTERFGPLQISLETRRRHTLTEGTGRPIAVQDHPERTTPRSSSRPGPWLIALLGALMAWVVARPGLR